jgi:hypothetical protein
LLSRDEFVERFIQGLQRAGEMRPIHYEADIFCLAIGENRDAPDVVIGMSEVFRSSESTPRDQLGASIDNLAKQYYRRPVPEEFGSAEQHLGLCLKHRTYLDLHAEFCTAWSGSAPPRVLAHVKVTDEMICCIGFLDGPAVQYVTQDRLARWGVGIEEALSTAIANLGKATFKLERQGSVYVTPPNDLDGAARFFLVRHVLDTLHLDGLPVVLVPSGDGLVITGSNDSEGLLQMAAMGQVFLEESPYPVSAQPLVWHQGEWKPFEPPEKIKPAFVHLAQTFEVDRYRAQMGVLALRYRHSHDEVGISEVQLFPTGDRHESYTVWRSDRPALLPKADRVALDDKVSGKFYVAEWSNFARVLADRIVPVHHSPVRFRVDRFPSAVEIQAMDATLLNVRQNAREHMAPTRSKQTVMKR